MNKIKISNENEVSFFDKDGKEIKLKIKKIDTDILIYEGKDYEVKPRQLKVIKKICLQGLEIELDEETAKELKDYVSRKYDN